jgi:Flp pilus assembly protein TadD
VNATAPPSHAPEILARRGYDLHVAGRHAEAEAAYRHALRLDPELAVTWSNLGLAVQAQGRLAEAEACQQQALRLAPDYPEAHSNLGLAQYAQARTAEAANSFLGALRLRPDYANAAMNLGIALQGLNRLDAAESCYREALALGAAPGQVLNNLGLLLYEQGRPAEAEQACREALAHAPEQPAARVNLAMALLLRGAFEEGWRAFEGRWQVPPMTAMARPFVQPQWRTGMPLEGTTVLLHAEQGFGDTLQFCRYAPLLAAAGARVLLEAPPALCRLLRSLPGVSQVIAAGAPLPAFDLHCPLMSLPGGFGTTLDTIPAAVPYLRADPAEVAAWCAILADLPGRRIGLVWAGSSRSEQPQAVAVDRRRSMPLAALAPLAEVAGCSFVSLQLGPPAGQSPPPGMVLHDHTARLRDFADTAALVTALDLVIAVDTAVAHLAGALGRPVWLLNRFDTCWRWLEGRDDSPWYPTLRQFRQPVAGDWASPVGQVAQMLARFAAAGDAIAAPLSAAGDPPCWPESQRSA